MKIIFYGIAIGVSLLGLNALVWYATHEIPKAHYQTPQEVVVMPDVKPTALITQLDEVIDSGSIQTIKFSAVNTNATHQVKKFECNIDNIAWSDCTSPKVLNLNEFDDNTHTLEIRVIDTQNGVEPQPLVHIFK